MATILNMLNKLYVGLCEDHKDRFVEENIKQLSADDIHMQGQVNCACGHSFETSIELTYELKVALGLIEKKEYIHSTNSMQIVK